MFNRRQPHSSFRPCLCDALAVCVGLLLTVSLPARATFVVAGNVADQTTFINLINADTQGGAWNLNIANQLLFAANGNALNNYATQLNALNNALNVRTVNVMQNVPGGLVGAFGPLYVPAQPAGTQLIDLGDILAFTANAAAQPQPLLGTRGSTLLHELAELNADGGALAFNNSHNTGIQEENNIMAFQGIMGIRLAGGAFNVTPAAPGTNFATYRMTVPFQTTAAVPAGGGQQALANGAMYNEVITGRITGAVAPFNFDFTNIARGLIDTGFSYDGTGYDVSIESITAQVVSEPSTLMLLFIGFACLLRQTATRRHAAAQGRAMKKQLIEQTPYHYLFNSDMRLFHLGLRPEISSFTSKPLTQCTAFVPHSCLRRSPRPQLVR